MKLNEVLGDNNGYQEIVLKDIDFEFEAGNPDIVDARFEYEAEPSEPRSLDSPGSPGGVSIGVCQIRGDRTNNQWVEVQLTPQQKAGFERQIEQQLSAGNDGGPDEPFDNGEVDNGPQHYIPSRRGV